MPQERWIPVHFYRRVFILFTKLTDENWPESDSPIPTCHLSLILPKTTASRACEYPTSKLERLSTFLGWSIVKETDIVFEGTWKKISIEIDLLEESCFLELVKGQAFFRRQFWQGPTWRVSLQPATSKTRIFISTKMSSSFSVFIPNRGRSG